MKFLFPDPDSPVDGLTYDPVTGLLFGSTRNSRLLSINLGTGLVTDVGATVAGIDALEFQTQPAAVPEPASLALLGIGAAGLPGYGWKRRQA